MLLRKPKNGYVDDNALELIVLHLSVGGEWPYAIVKANEDAEIYIPDYVKSASIIPFMGNGVWYSNIKVIPLLKDGMDVAR